jgi:hypothetical protein
VAIGSLNVRGQELKSEALWLDNAAAVRCGIRAV